MWEELLGLFVGDSATNNDVVAIDPVGRRCHFELCCQLQRVNHAKNLIKVATSACWIGDGQLDLLIWSDDEHRTHRHGVAGVGVDHVVQVGDVLVAVTNHWEIDSSSLGLCDVCFPLFV